MRARRWAAEPATGSATANSKHQLMALAQDQQRRAARFGRMPVLSTRPRRKLTPPSAAIATSWQRLSRIPDRGFSFLSLKFRDREFSTAAGVILQRDAAAVGLEGLSAQAAHRCPSRDLLVLNRAQVGIQFGER